MKMSRQLAISSTFASFAMAAMALAYTPSSYARPDQGLGDFSLQVEQTLPDPPSLQFFSN
jgi:hypothetical protein